MLEIQKPKVYLLNESGIGNAEIAARTCYDSFENSENESIINFNKLISSNDFIDEIMNNKPNENKEKIKEILLKNTILDTKSIEHSDLLNQLAWVHHHHSILEHIHLTYYIEGTSRGVLQEHARHRIHSLSVRSTRYTMNDILYAFIASLKSIHSKEWFVQKLVDMDMFVQIDDYRYLLATQIWDKLNYHLILFKEEFYEMALSKENMFFYENNKHLTSDEIFKQFLIGKKKRNVGDNFKDIVDDNWKVNLVSTFNLRSLKNYFTLRNSGAAYYQIRILAEEMINVTPKKYLDLILKAK